MALNNLVELKYVCTGGDEIDYFDTIHTTEAPLSKYLAEIFKTEEWGDIDIYWEGTGIRLEYATNGEYRTDSLIISNLQDKIVYKAFYKGGWSYGHWILYIREE